MKGGWVKGDKLTAQNLNLKTQQIARGGVVGGGGSKSVSRSPDLVFRQEGSPMPADGETFPIYYSRKAFSILGIQCFGGGLSGTYTVALKTDTEHGGSVTIATYSNGDDGVTYVDKDVDSFVSEGDKVILEVTTSTDVEDFQANVLLRLLS